VTLCPSNLRNSFEEKIKMSANPNSHSPVICPICLRLTVLKSELCMGSYFLFVYNCGHFAFKENPAVIRPTNNVSQSTGSPYWRIRKSPQRKYHIAKRKKAGYFRSLCGLRFSYASTSGVRIDTYRGDECLRCQRATSKKQYEPFFGWKIIVRLKKEGDHDN